MRPSREVVYHPSTDAAFIARVEETVPILAHAVDEELEAIIRILQHTANPEAKVVMGADRIDVFRDLDAYRESAEAAKK